MAKKRIEYIDAMRGFTMILVIYSHVCVFCFKDYFMAFNDVLFLLRMPCFFFISGWLFYKATRIWDQSTVKQVMSNKFMVQIVPTFIFLALHERTNFFHQLGAVKGGYWFTFALFIYFVIYILSSLAFRRCKHRDLWMLLIALFISMAASWYDVHYQQISCQLGWGRYALGFLSFMTWRYYLFFFLGTLVKKNFDKFLEWTDRREVADRRNLCVDGKPAQNRLLAVGIYTICCEWHLWHGDGIHLLSLLRLMVYERTCSWS